MAERFPRICSTTAIASPRPFSGPIVIRFFQKNFSDDAAGLAGQSLVTPGNQNPSGTSYGDKQGRKLLYTISP